MKEDDVRWYIPHLDVRHRAVHDWPVPRETFPIYLSKIVRL